MRSMCVAVAMLNVCVPVAAQETSAPARSEMIVFFRWDTAELDSSGEAVVKTAVERAKTCKAVTVELVGHDDTSQSSQRAQELSELRAQTVKRVLAAAGLPEVDIKTEGRGDKEPMFGTPDDVKEPMNRRVAISVLCGG